MKNDYLPKGSNLLDFLYKIEGKDIWFKALANYDWMYYLRVLEIYPDEKTCLCEYYDCDNPDENLLEGFDTMEVDIDSIEVDWPVELMTTEELEEWRAVIEYEYEATRQEWDDDYDDYDEDEDDEE